MSLLPTQSDVQQREERLAYLERIERAAAYMDAHSDRLTLRLSDHVWEICGRVVAGDDWLSAVENAMKAEER